MGALAAALSATTMATAAEEVAAEPVGMIVASVRGGVTSLVNTASRTRLAMFHGGTILVRTVLRATLASLRYHCHQEGTMTTARTMGSGASKSLVLLPAFWVALRPSPPIASSGSSLVR